MEHVMEVEHHVFMILHRHMVFLKKVAKIILLGIQLVLKLKNALQLMYVEIVVVQHQLLMILIHLKIVGLFKNNSCGRLRNMDLLVELMKAEIY